MSGPEELHWQAKPQCYTGTCAHTTRSEGQPGEATKGKPTIKLYNHLSLLLRHCNYTSIHSTFGYDVAKAEEVLKGEVHPKWKISHIVVLGALSRMVKVRSACNKLFWIISGCIIVLPSNRTVMIFLVIASLACPPHKNDSSTTTKTASLSGAGWRNYSIAYISKAGYRMHFGPSPFTQHPEHYEM